MYSADHLLISAIVGVILAILTTESMLLGAAVVVYAVALGVGIDLDHFLIARLNAGKWRAVRRGIEDPRRLVFAQHELFRPREVSPSERMLSHLVLGGLLVGGLWVVTPWLAVVSGVVVYVHVLADAAADSSWCTGILMR